MNRQTRQPQKEKAAGFTLLEVMVAATLMGLVLVIILQVLTSTLRAQEASRRNTQAVLAAQKVLEEISDKELSRGVFQGKEGGFAYEVSLVPQFQVPYPNQNKEVVCSLVKLKVFWKEHGKTKSLELQTMRTTVQKQS
jgi:prepilin-type N-terminal cleavage/methylation domain-containing protein